jgi:hypothetical protein
MTLMKVERAVSAARAARLQAQQQVRALDAKVSALRLVADELDEGNPAPLEWTPVDGSLDDVLVLLN